MPTELTPEQKRINFAEACPSVFGIRKESRDVYIKNTGQEVDPLEDLNAMAQAEATRPNREGGEIGCAKNT